MAQEKPRDPVLPIVLLILVLGVAFAAYYYWLRNERAASAPERVVTEPVSGPIGQPQVRHPIERPPEEAAKPLPPLGQSDAPLREEAAAFLSGEQLARLFHLDSIVRRVVVTVDALPRQKLAQRYHIARPVAGRFVVQGKGDRVTLGESNYKRYTPYVQLAESVDLAKLVALYVHYYPLLQQEYENLGYPNKYFNDRVIEAIDDLLAAPEIREPVELVQPKVMYQYADPKLEALSAGQKIMIRMGPDNAARIKARLRELRRQLASAP